MNRQPTPTVVAAVPHAADPSAPFLVLEIVQGQTRFPRRPVVHDRFLIGGAAGCDLQLGGATPPLHSLVWREGRDLWIEAVVPVPPLAVNGRTCEHAVLRDGDLIAIGPFQMAARIEPVDRLPVLAAEKGPVPPLGQTSEEPNALAHLSAAALIERIDAEERDVARFEAGRRIGAQGLLAAVGACAAAFRTGGGGTALPFRRERSPSLAVATSVDLVLPVFPEFPDTESDAAQPTRAAA